MQASKPREEAQTNKQTTAPDRYFVSQYLIEMPSLVLSTSTSIHLLPLLHKLSNRTEQTETSRQSCCQTESAPPPLSRTYSCRLPPGGDHPLSSCSCRACGTRGTRSRSRRGSPCPRRSHTPSCTPTRSRDSHSSCCRSSTCRRQCSSRSHTRSSRRRRAPQ